MYPLQKSKWVQAIGKWARKRLGKKIGKKVPFYISMSILWFLIGLWHGGTGYYFIASGGIPCILFLFSSLCRPLCSGAVKKMHINTGCASWRWFRRVRTLLLICICWMVVCSTGTHNFMWILKYSLFHPWNYMSFNAIAEAAGLTSIDVLLMAAGLIMLFLSDLSTYRGESIFQAMDRQNYLIKVFCIYLEVIIILMHGMVGSSPFIYFQF